MIWLSWIFAERHDSGSVTVMSLLLCLILWTAPLMPKVDKAHGVSQHLAILSGCCALGVSFGTSLRYNTSHATFMSLFCYFHFSEFVLISFSHGRCTFDSLLLNHGFQYAGAFSLSLAEIHFVPLGLPSFCKHIGLCMAIIGLLIRALALLTAGRAFTHLISDRKSFDHSLVQRGIYQYMRHPGYCGWLMWVTSSQILAGNPICATVFCLISWSFFKDRIEYEESLLVNMFGSEYTKYRSRVTFSGIPFID